MEIFVYVVVVDNAVVMVTQDEEVAQSCARLCGANRAFADSKIDVRRGQVIF